VLAVKPFVNVVGPVTVPPVKVPPPPPPVLNPVTLTVPPVVFKSDKTPVPLLYVPPVIKLPILVTLTPFTVKVFADIVLDVKVFVDIRVNS
jgi:hypothetical protein